MGNGWVLFHGLPSLAVIDFHPIIISVLGLSSVLQSLCEEVTQIIVIRFIFKSKIADITEIFIEFLCKGLVQSDIVDDISFIPGNPSQRSLMAVVCFFSPIFWYF